MNHRELERIRTVTRHFADLKGLESTVPWGLMLFAGGFSWGSYGRLGPLISLFFLAGAAVIGILAPRFYRARFGEVESLGAPRAAMAVAALDVPRYFGGIAVPGHRHRLDTKHVDEWILWLRSNHLDHEMIFWYFVYNFVGIGKTFGWPSPAQGTQIVLTALATLLIWRWVRLSMQSGQAYYPATASFVLLLAAAVGTTAGTWLSLDRSGAELLVGGGMWVLVGLFDHLTLARTLGPGVAPRLAVDTVLPREEER